MMKKNLITLSIAGSLAWTPTVVFGQSIIHSAGQADLTFFYDSGEDSFDVVFRDKGESTVASGLDDPYAGPPGGVGGSSGDFNFTSLTADLTQAPQVSVNGRDYFVSPASGSVYSDDSIDPDLGVRMRFREDDGGDTVDQFVSFEMTLDWATSTRPDGAEFALFGFDELDQPIIRYETAETNFSEIWDVWGHTHWHWGFTEQGSYSLDFSFQGEFADGTFSDVGTTTVGFEVIPEPGTWALLLGLGALGVAGFYRSRRSKTVD